MIAAAKSGIISKQAVPVTFAPTIIGTLGAGVSMVSTDWITYKYTGTRIVIPANSKYIINAVMLIRPYNIPYNTQALWVRTSFSDSPTSFATSANIQGSVYVVGSIGSNSESGLVQGAIIVNNTTGAAKTYYYWVGDIGRTGITEYGGTIQDFGGGSVRENQLYATPIN